MIPFYALLLFGGEEAFAVAEAPAAQWWPPLIRVECSRMPTVRGSNEPTRITIECGKSTAVECGTERITIDCDEAQ